MGTFGNSTIGANTSLASSQINGSRFQGNGIVSKITVYTAAETDTMAMITAVFADNSGHPGALIATSSEVTGIGTTPSWIDFPINCTLPPANYWLVLYSLSSYAVYYDPGGSVCFLNDPADYPNFPNPFNPEFAAVSLSIYATYTVPTYGVSGSGWQVSGPMAAVNFPLAPQNCTDRNPVVETDFPVGGQQSVVISEGLDVRVLTLKGFFYVASQNKSYLDTTFCDPLLGLNRQVVTLACPTTRYNGSWLLIVDTLDDKAEGLLQRYFYTLILKQGAAFVVL
jgi:hypothetical protein